MASRTGFSYTQARVQARHGERLSPAQWRRLESSRELGPYLQVARSTSLKTWAHQFTAHTGAAEIEHWLRRDWMVYADEVAHWVPIGWRPAVAWAGFLAYLPALNHLLHGQPAVSWMREDSLLEALDTGDPAARLEALRESPLAALAKDLASGDTVLSAWLAEWRRRWPDPRPRETTGLERLIDTIEALPGTKGNASPVSTTELGHAELRATLCRLFRSGSGTAVAVFCHLGLVAIDLARLRGGLLTRVLFPVAQGANSWA